MKKVFLALIMLFVFINVKALNLDLNSKYVYVYNLTEDKVMYELNSNEEIKVASMTKIMTAIIVIEKNKDLNKLVKIKDEDLRDMYEYTTTGFQNGDEVSIKELLYGILLASGSDAVNAAVRVTTNTEEEFVKLMNQKVKELGLTNTNFSNPVGKDKDNYSSAHDIAEIMKYALKNNIFKEIISTNMYYIDRLDLQINGPLYKAEDKYDIDSTFIKGGKNGYTNAAKFSLVSYGEKDDVTYIVVTDWASSYKDVLSDTSKIYEYFFNNYSYVNYDSEFNINIINGKEKEYNVVINEKIYLPNEYDKKKLTYEYKGKNNISVLNKKGSKIGKVFIYYDKELLKTVDVIINKDIEYKSNRYILPIIFIVFIVLIIIILMIVNFKIRHIKKSIKRSKISYESKKEVEQFIKEENSIENKLNILQTTTDVSIFFNNIKNINEIDKKSLEHDFIDRCFENIDFTKEENLKALYTKLKLYKSDMLEETLKYASKLFKYCIENYINKN